MKRSPRTAKSWERVKLVFEIACDLVGEARAKYLEEATRGSASLRQEVEALLAADVGAQGFLDNPVGPRLLASSDAAVRKAYARFEAGHKLGDFEIRKTLGSGSFATVYLARQISLDRLVALKVSADQGEEARTLASLEHENIVRVHSESVDKRRKLRLVCMQYVLGVGLDRVLAEAKARTALPDGRGLLEIVSRLLSEQSQAPVSFPPDQLSDRDVLSRLDYSSAILWIASRIARALDYAHDRGVLHLDVKPENILLTPWGRPLLTDFNVAISEAQLERGNPELFGGTPEYMAPEHLDVFYSTKRESLAEKLDPRADVYSLGKVVEVALVENRSDGNPFDAFTRGVDATILVRAATHPQREKRIATCGELARLLDACREFRSIHTRIREPGMITRWVSRHPLLFLGVMGLIPVLIGLTGSVLYTDMFLMALLSDADAARLTSLLLGWLPAFGFAGAVGWMLYLGRFRKALGDPEALFLSEAWRRRWRKECVRLGSVGALLSLTILVPPLWEWATWNESLYQNPPLAWNAFRTFALPFCIAILAVSSYARLYTEIVATKTLYPRFLMGETEVRELALRDLRHSRRNLIVFQTAAVLAPLVLGALALWVSWNEVDIISFRQTHIYLLMCLMSAFCGGAVLWGALGRFSQTHDVLTGSGTDWLR